jgi:hypothetical protein
MMLEVLHDEKYTPPSQRRPNGHVVLGGTKKGNKKRGLRVRLAGLLEKELEADEEEEEDDLTSMTVDLLR